ncbi:MAG: HAMP domain-containing histidine kinase [Methylotenera sp.]|nr:HAMP domain-containing histidine kinase [Oligoflexia bacterium]
MDKYRKGAVITLGIFCLQALLVTVSEIPLIPEQQRIEYFSLKLALVLAAIPLSVGLSRNYSSPWLHTSVMLSFAAYTIQGQCYRPLYYFAFFQLSTVVAFMFAVPKRIFTPLLIAWVAIFIFVIHLKWDQYVAQMQKPVFSDIVLSITSVGLVAWLCQYYFTSDRLFREAALSRFGRIGMQSARLVHDLKGLTSAPRIYAEMLAEKLANHTDPTITEALTHLSRDLENLSAVVLEMNQMSAIKDSSPTEFTAADLISSIQTVLGKSVAHVEFEISDLVRMKANRAVFNSIFLNLILNALESFSRNQTKNPVLSLRSGKNSLIVKDNGGGFSRQTLEYFSSQRFTRREEQGSGLGLWFIQDSVGELSGRMKIYNEGCWACVEMNLPKGMVVTG